MQARTKKKTNIGPLHTQAKSRDHEIVSPEESVQRPSQHTSKTMVVWSRIRVKSMGPVPLPNVILKEFYSCGSSRMVK